MHTVYIYQIFLYFKMENSQRDIIINIKINKIEKNFTIDLVRSPNVGIDFITSEHWSVDATGS